MKQLPSYMKISYVALYNYINEMAYHILKEQDLDVIEHPMKIWEDIAEAQIVEARWFHSQYKPTLEEYMENAYVSVTGPAISTLAYLSAANPIVEKEVEFIGNHPPLVKLASMAFRLQDDLGTATVYI
ncbi:(R)-limonene synthase 1, chloroplastic-like [Mangifera indica]|uniref:(R)-limonene synthase 1, chloroplastic-like n=1 Tax=Mangifera indica TaxID=29780 RepID=UPI001CF9ADD8|nr:(R)-limonene synthase 1, chloroplastic-like [Mangifera indica]